MAPVADAITNGGVREVPVIDRRAVVSTIVPRFSLCVKNSVTERSTHQVRMLPGGRYCDES